MWKMIFTVHKKYTEGNQNFWDKGGTKTPSITDGHSAIKELLWITKGKRFYLPWMLLHIIVVFGKLIIIVSSAQFL